MYCKKRIKTLLFLLCGFSCVSLSGGSPAPESFDEITVVERKEAEGARQGVAVDPEHFYTIGTRSVMKYDKQSGRQTAKWSNASGDGEVIHLDSGVVVDGILYCGHSNYPRKPMESSVEVWECKTLKKLPSIRFPENHGSCTWVDRYRNAWWACFGHYGKGPKGGVEGKDTKDTLLVKYEGRFRKELGRWTFPEEVIGRFEPYSCSGGSWGPDGYLYCNGHHRKETYVLKLPKEGTVLEYVKTLKVEAKGQGLAWDRSTENRLLMIDMSRREVLFCEAGRKKD